MERPCPSEEPVILSQSFAFAPVKVTGLMQAKETAYAAHEQHATREAENADNPHEGKTTAGLLSSGLGISPLVFWSVRHSEGGGVNDFGAQTMPKLLCFDQQSV